MDGPLYRKFRQQAKRVLKLPANGSAKDRIRALKDYLNIEGEKTRRLHRRGEGGLVFGLAHTATLDVLIES